MMAEQQQPPPAAEFTSMMWMDVGLVVVGSVIIALVLHSLLHFRSLWKDQRMKPASSPLDASSDKPPERFELKAAPEAKGDVHPDGTPIERSINDVHLMREQDQTIAQLTAQLDDMHGSPWVRETVGRDAGWPSDQVPKTRLRALGLLLTMALNPPANKGAQSAISGYGKLCYVTIGNRRIAAAGDKEANALVERVNSVYYEATAEWRAGVLKNIAALAKAAVDESHQDTYYLVACGQTKVMTLNEDEHTAMYDKLAGLFEPIFDAERHRIMDELAAAAGA